MKGIWVKDIEDIVNLGRQIGFIMYFKLSKRTHVYYVRCSGEEGHVHYIMVALSEPLKGKFVALGDEGQVKISDTPIMPICAKITEVVFDLSLAEMLKERVKGGWKV